MGSVKRFALERFKCFKCSVINT